MTASNFGGFSWTEEKSSIILEIMTHLIISKKLDVLADGTIEIVFVGTPGLGYTLLLCLGKEPYSYP